MAQTADAQKPTAFFVAMDDQENKNDENTSQTFSESLQVILTTFKPKLLQLPNITAVSTKQWKAQNTTVVVLSHYKLFLISFYPISLSFFVNFQNFLCDYKHDI